MRLTQANVTCPNCQAPLIQTPGKRAKAFCDSNCRSNYWQKQQRLAKKEVAGLPLPADYVGVQDVAILHTNGTVEDIVELKVGDKKAWNKALKESKTYGKKKKVNKKVKAKEKVTVTDLTKPTGKKVVSDPPPKTNFTIAMPVRKKGEDAFDFASRKNEWKRKQK